MDGLTELAQMLYDCKNPAAYSPVFGTIISLPDVKISLGSKIILKENRIRSIFNLQETETLENGSIRYVNLNKTVLLLPYADNQKYIALGIVQ